MGGGGQAAAPQPTAEEVAIQREQLELMRIERTRSEALEPFVLQSLGLVREPRPGAVRMEERLVQVPVTRLVSGFGTSQSQTVMEERRVQVPVEEPGGFTFRRMTEEERVAAQTPIERLAEQNLTLSLQREQRALKGELPVSEGTRQQKAEEFRLFKEAQGRFGNPITGETPETATAGTTAGIQALEQFRERFSLIEDAERRGELSEGSRLVLARLGLTQDLAGARASGFATFGRAPGQIAGGLSGLLEPLEAQRGLAFQAAQANAQRRAATQQALIGAGGAVAAAGLTAWLAGAGGTAAAAAPAAIALSSRTVKKGIRRATRRDEDKALEMVEDLKTRTFRFKGEPDTVPKRMGLISEEVPAALATPDGRAIDVGRLMGLLTVATRALARRAERKEA